MNEKVLNDEQKVLLTSIMNDKFSVGAFCGMIFNTYCARPNPTVTIDSLIKEALDVRLRANKLIQEEI